MNILHDFLVIEAYAILIFLGFEEFHWRRYLLSGRYGSLVSGVYLISLIALFALSEFGNSVIGLLACFSILLYVLKIKQSLVSWTLEAHYEFLLLLTLVLLEVGYTLPASFIAGCICISSISAGLAKLRSPIWVKEKSAMARFLAMPWLARHTVRRLYVRIIRALPYARIILRFVSNSLPWIQIISGMGALSIILLSFMKLPTLVLFWAGASIFLQLIFCILLFIIAGLGMIPFLYSSILMIFVNNQYTVSVQSVVNLDYQFLDWIVFIVSIIYVLYYLLTTLLDVKAKPLSRYYPLLPYGCFHMFTESNTEGMILFHINGNINSTYSFFRNFPNPFLISGEKSVLQNLQSTKFFCFFYPLMDFLILQRSRRSLGRSFLGDDLGLSGKKLINNLFAKVPLCKITYSQFTWNNELFFYESSGIAEISIEEDRIIVTETGTLKPCHRRVYNLNR